MAPHWGQNRWEGIRSRAWKERLVLDQETPLFHYDGERMGVGTVVAAWWWGAIIRGGSCLVFSKRQKMHSLDGISSSHY